MTTEPSHKMRAIRAAINKFDAAAQELAFKGSAHPDDQPAIVHQYEKARAALETLIERNLK